MSNIDTYAKIYTERYGWNLVPIKERGKIPALNDWGNNTITEPQHAVEYWRNNPHMNMGLELGQSNMCSLDIDCLESFKLLLEEFGFDFSDLDNYPTIKGSDKGKRLMFRLPDGVKYAKLNWPAKEDPKKKYTVFELRSSDSKQRQDLLPPSWHDGAGREYEWEVKPPAAGEEWQLPPEWLVTIWQNWDKLGEQFKEACPWLEVREVEKRAQRTPTRHSNDNKGNEVVETFNSSYPLDQMLETYGYKRKGKRYLSPHSTTGLPGVHILTGGDKCWIHHASDPMCSEDKGQPVSSYDLFVEYEHRGDRSAAFKAAAEMLGISLKLQPTTYTAPPSHDPIPQSMVTASLDHNDMDIDFDPFIYLGNEEIDKAAPRMPSEPPQAGAAFVDTVSPLGYANGKGAPLNHHENLSELCTRLGVVIRYNVIKKEEEIIIPRMGFSMDNQANAALAWLISQCSVFNFPTGKVSEFVTLLADRNQYNPVVEWVRSKDWDGESRLQKLFDTVTVTGDNELKETLIKRWMISAIIGAFSSTGVSAQGVLIMQGSQGLGKTSWFKSLVPAELDLIKDGMLLRPDSPDSVVQACSNWLVELGELDATFKKADIAALKSFITNNRDVLRLPYARKSSKFARRTLFFGSVNPKQFLHDPTGSRRFWTLEVTDLDVNHGLDMQQVWAELYTMWKGGEVHYLLPEEEAKLNESNDDFQVVDPVEERIKTSFNWAAEERHWEWLTATEIVIKSGIDKPTKAEINTAGAVIKALNGGKSKKSGSKRMLLCAPELGAFR